MKLATKPIPGRADTNEKKRAILDRLYAIWVDHPHLRLGQLLANALRHSPLAFNRLFYIEDEILMDLLEKSE